MGMKLSEAILAGSKLRPKVKGEPFRLVDDDINGEWGSCAIGAACEAVVPDFQTQSISHKIKLFQETWTTQAWEAVCNALGWTRHYPLVQNPVSGEHGYLDEIIMTLNDHEGWSREQIAEWLEGIGY